MRGNGKSQRLPVKSNGSLMTSVYVGGFKSASETTLGGVNPPHPPVPLLRGWFTPNYNLLYNGIKLHPFEAFRLHVFSQQPRSRVSSM